LDLSISVDIPRLGVHRSDRITQQEPEDRSLGGVDLDAKGMDGAQNA